MTKAKNLAEWRTAMSELNLQMFNTCYADREGNIFYVYNGAVPKRDPSFDWTKPVDGSDPRTEWQGLHAFDELPQILNPASGYLQNCNSTPVPHHRRRQPVGRRLPGLHGRRQERRQAPGQSLADALAGHARRHVRRLASGRLRHHALLAADEPAAAGARAQSARTVEFAVGGQGPAVPRTPARLGLPLVDRLDADDALRAVVRGAIRSRLPGRNAQGRVRPGAGAGSSRPWPRRPPSCKRSMATGACPGAT